MTVVPALVLILLVAVVALLTWRGAGRRVHMATCCSKRAWPPDDLTGACGRPAQRPAEFPPARAR